MKRTFALLFLLTLIFNVAYAQELPLKDCVDAPLINFNSNLLKNQLYKQLSADPKVKSLIDHKKMSVGIVSLEDVNNIQYAGLNGEEMMYAASLPKIAILLAAMDAIDKGELKETDEVKHDMWLMISKSNNQASTRMIDRLGYDKINGVLTSDKYKLYDKKVGGGLWVGKRYAAAGERRPDPIKGLSHAATAEQVCRFYYKLVTGTLVNAARSKEMLSIMEHPSLHHKFVNTLERIAPDARLFRKSGSWKTFHSDSILVWGDDGRKYILVALVNDADGEQIIRNLVVPVERAIKKSRTLIASVDKDNDKVSD
ncbi:serine hydrolase [Leeuwenhoekiella sp. A16]|uniref:serine hydrolase n=1 Tax=unclassified Leeuwenhoekiella TaxID=2615029 RepID=UPI003A801C44